MPHRLFNSKNPVLPYIRHAKIAVRDPWTIPDRRLLDYLLLYVQEGHCIVKTEDRTFELKRGDFALIQPDTLHSLEGRTKTITPFIHMDIFYHPDREQSFPTRPGQTHLDSYSDLLQPKLNDIAGLYIPVHFMPKQAARFRDTMAKTIEVWNRRDTVSLLEAQALTTELIHHLIKDHMDHDTLRAPGSLSWIPSYLSFYLSEPITVDDMAKEAGLSASHFSSLFLKQFGMSPYQYLCRLRLDHARELLIKTDLSQQQIAEYCGFADVHHFSKAFKKETGQTPGAYRKSI
jgi:AraC-like DNA-binding protein